MALYLWCAVLVAQSCLTLCDPMDCSPPGFSIPGISQARVLEWGAIAFSEGGAYVRVSIGNYFTSLITFISRYFILDTIVTGVVFLISFLDCCLWLMYYCCYCSSVVQSCLTLCHPMDYSTPGFPVHHQLLHIAQSHVH